MAREQKGSGNCLGKGSCLSLEPTAHTDLFQGHLCSAVARRRTRTALGTVVSGQWQRDETSWSTSYWWHFQLKIVPVWRALSQVALKKPKSLKQQNNKFTFNFGPYSWRFFVVCKRNAVVPPFLKTAENGFFKCFLKKKKSSLSFP